MSVDKVLFLPSLRIPLCFALAAIALFGCASGGIGDNASTKVEGAQDSIVFSWEPDHPWASQFAEQGSNFSLYAQYVADGNPVEQNLGRPRKTAQQQWVFSLPRDLRTVPQSNVCLFFSHIRSSVSIPLRLKAMPGGDTARFRFPEWEQRVVASTKASKAEGELKAMEALIADSRLELSRLRTDLSRQGITRVEDCNRAADTPAVRGDEAPPADVVSPSQQAGAAERICVRRSRNMKRFRDEYKIDLDVLAEQLVSDTNIAANDQSKLRARAFLTHWAKWRDRTGPEFTPQLGTATEGLPTAGVLDDTIKTWNNTSIPKTTASRQTVAAGLLDAYFGCLDDTGKQLAIRNAAWERSRALRPTRDRLFAERRLEQCQAQVAGIETLAKELAVQEKNLSERKIVASSTERSQPENMGSRPAVLNGYTCSIQKQ